MNAKDYRKRYAIEQKNKSRILKVNPRVPETSGIYFFTRRDEDGFKYAYIGQAKHLLSRLAQHLSGYQHIDLSLKSHGFYESESNPYGWDVNFICFPISVLDEKEQYYIRQYADHGYQLRNKTSGSQGKGKRQIDEYKPRKGYRDGISQGRKNASRDIAHLFEKHLDYKPKSDPPTHYQLQAMGKFEDFLNEHNIPDDNGAINTDRIEREKYGRSI